MNRLVRLVTLVGLAAASACSGYSKDGTSGGTSSSSKAPAPCTEGDTQVCGKAFGECHAGVQTCTKGQWSDCNDVGPTLEVCDGLDNDCNGTIDDHCECTPGATQTCGVTLGECTAGMQKCDERGKWGSCEGAAAPSSEQCDGLDNDCNGTIDDNCECIDGETQDCGATLGSCKAGTQTCDHGRWKACKGAVLPTSETCDGVDNDCNGIIDDNCDCQAGATRWCNAGDGVCHSGTQTCEEGEWGECTPVQAGVPETCDGQDNDCDGQVDNGFALDEPCNSMGKCPQVRACSSDGQSSACRNEPRLYSDEICDGIDNDCDGYVDRVPDGGRLRSVCACDSQTLGIGDAKDVSIADNMNLCAPTACGPDRPAKLSIDGTCYPVCVVPGSDPDGDGWGWENGATCIVKTSARAQSAKPCGSDGLPIGMAMTYCLDCSNADGLPYAMCESVPHFDLTRFARGELWLKVDYTFTSAGAANAPVNLWFTSGGLRKRLPLVTIGQMPGDVNGQLLTADGACFTPSEDFGSDCSSAAQSCAQCGSGEVCGALTECGDYALTQATLQVAAEFCKPESGDQTGTVVIHKVELVGPNCQN